MAPRRIEKAEEVKPRTWETEVEELLKPLGFVGRDVKAEGGVRRRWYRGDVVVGAWMGQCDRLSLYVRRFPYGELNPPVALADITVTPDGPHIQLEYNFAQLQSEEEVLEFYRLAKRLADEVVAKFKPRC